MGGKYPLASGQSLATVLTTTIGNISTNVEVIGALKYLIDKQEQTLEDLELHLAFQDIHRDLESIENSVTPLELSDFVYADRKYKQ
jgi:hypothetical protein